MPNRSWRTLAVLLGAAVISVCIASGAAARSRLPKDKPTRQVNRGHVNTPRTVDTSTSTPPVLGTFDISTPAQLAAWKAAGGSAIVIPIHWAQAQPQDGPVSLATAGDSGDNVISEIEGAHAAGIEVFLDLGLQYPPQWVLDSVPEFIDQGGDSWSSSHPGADVRDWIWNASGRTDVARYVLGALTDLRAVLPDVSGIRAGGGIFGELDFPASGIVDGVPSMWGYDAAAQHGVGLAAGETKTPLPGYAYGTGTSAEDTEWANWYLDSLASWIRWETQLLRLDGYTGPIYVLHPSSGMRPNLAPRTAAYEQQLAYGTDPAVMMDYYDQVPNVWPWSTWADDPEPYWHPGDTVPSDASAWRYLLELAQQRGLATHIMGENTGGGTAAPIHEMMSGALASGYTGMFYLDFPYAQTMGLLPYLVNQFDTDGTGAMPPSDGSTGLLGSLVGIWLP